MTDWEADFASSDSGPVLSSDSERARTVVRRRRRRPARRQGVGRWVAARGRRRRIGIFAVSAGVLLLMALGLYIGLMQQNSGPRVPGVGALSRATGARSSA